jgi:tetratricopeptide (TPR) repeat protein
MLRSVPVAAALLALAGTAAAQDPAAADAAWHAGEMERAERLYAEILAADSTHYTALHRTALLRAWADEHAASLALFDRLLRLYPEATDARVDRARVVAWRGDVESAIAALEAVLDDEPGNVAAVEALAQFESWAGRYDEALRAYSRLARLDPERESVRYDRARVLAWASRFEAAGVVYDSILADDPTDVAALEGKARTLLWAGRTDSAAVVFERLLEVDPGNTAAGRGLAQGAAWDGDLGLAERRWRAVIESAPDDVEARVGLSRTLRWQGRDGEAMDVADQALGIDPTSGDAREELRLARLALAPSAAPAFAHESDSDGNRITTLSATGRFHFAPGLSLRVDAYTRAASERSAAALEHRAHGGTVSAALQVRGGWRLTGGVGLTTTDVEPDPVPALTAAVSTPGWEPVQVTLSVRRQAFDATARLIEQRVAMTDLAANVRVRVADGTRLDLAAGAAWFMGEVSGEANRRWSGYFSLSRQLGSPFTVAATARTFGYAHDLLDGYFDPDFFGLAEVAGGWQRSLGPLEVRLNAAPGLQRVRFEGDTRPVGRVTGSLTWPLGPGRELAVTGLFTNAGLGRFSGDDDAGYTYRAATARLSWSF